MTSCIFAGKMELGRAQNEQKLKVDCLIRPSVQPKVSDYGYKVNALIEMFALLRYPKIRSIRLRDAEI